jgi:RHS repeat-associated protein
MGCLKIPYQEKKHENSLRVAYRNFAESPEKRSKYYPFGLTMSGISSKAAGGMENHKKFVGQEFNEDFDVDLYEFKWRHHDPQIGRFIEVDPLADKYVYNSPYAYAENRPIDGIDLEGLEFARKVDANCVTFQITTQTVLNTNAVSPQMANAINQNVNKTLGNAFSGVTDQQTGVSYSASYNSNVVATGDAKNSIVVSIQDFVTDEKGGYINGTNAGNSQSGIISVAALDMSNVSKIPGAYEPACTPRSAVEIGATIAHELPHEAGKLGHPWDPNQPSDILQNCPDGTRSNVSNKVIVNNVMNSGGNPDPKLATNSGRTTLTPGQVNAIDQKVQSDINEKKKNN